MSESRKILNRALRAALSAVHGRNCVIRALADRPLSADRVAVLAIGKAAAAMAAGASEALNGPVSQGGRMAGCLIATKYGHGEEAPDGVEVLESAHPVPDQASLDAGEAVARFASNLPAGLPVLVLVSGGASALVERPWPGIGLDDIKRANRWLLGSGLDIHAMNAVRSRLSTIKAGGLARLLAGREVRGLLISDVRGDEPAVIGSGPLVLDDRRGLPDGLPEWLEDLCGRGPEAQADARPATLDIEIVASLEHAKQAAAESLRDDGLAVTLHDEFLDEDAGRAGLRLARVVLDAAPGAQVWGGETVVTLPENPGRGGRSQHLALSAATVIAGQPDVYLLAAGTDGTDGPGEDAGGLVDGATIDRARGLDIADYLARADAGTVLAASGDLLRTGPTGTNVMDLVIGLKSGA
ncbi:MAG: glycerate kinase type-2 family protein [Gammaproteobacteria bacterium]